MPLAERTAAEFEDPTPRKPSEYETAKARTEVLRLLGPDPVAVDEIVRQCQMFAAIVAVILLELELAGRLERHPGNRVSLVP